MSRTFLTLLTCLFVLSPNVVMGQSLDGIVQKGSDFLCKSTGVGCPESVKDYSRGSFYIWFAVSLDIYEDKTIITSDYTTFYTEEDCKKELMRGLSDQKSFIASELRISGDYTVRKHSIGNGITLTKPKLGGGRQEVTCIDKNLTDSITYKKWVDAIKGNSK